MSEKRKREFMEKLNSCYSVVQQSSAKGISAISIAHKLNVHRTTVHSYLNTLELMGKVYSEKGLWYPKEDSSPLPLPEKESEITIELPLTEKQKHEMALCEQILQMVPNDKLVKAQLKALQEARTIRIKGKNIEDFKEELRKIILETFKSK